MSLDLRAVSVWFYVTKDSKLRKRNHAATMYATRWYCVAPCAFACEIHLGTLKQNNPI